MDNTPGRPGTLFAELKQQPLALSVLSRVRDAIIEGRLKPGEPLIQSQLASQLGVSRAPIREALSKLEDEGLVVSVPYRGTIVAPLYHRDVEELRSLRSVIERFAAQLMIDRMTDDDVCEFEAILDRMRAAADAGDTAAVDLEDLAIHTKICELSDHALLLEIWQLYAKRFRRVLALRNTVNRDLHTLVDLHAPLVDALRNRDLNALMAFYDSHGTDLTTVLGPWTDSDAFLQGGPSAGNGNRPE